MGSIGAKRPDSRRGPGGSRGNGWAAEDPFSLFGETGRSASGHARPAPEGRTILNAHRRALDALGLKPTPSVPISRRGSSYW